MKVFITKYALTTGIQEVEAYKSHTAGSMLYRPDPKYPYHTVYLGTGEWHLNKQDAIKAAEAQRAKKIASLKKQIEKLQKLNFQ